MMMMMMMMNCFVVWLTNQRCLVFISSQDHCQRSSPLQISDMLRSGFEPAQNLSSGLIEWSCAVVIITTPRCHKFNDWVIQWYKKVINLFISTSPFLWCAPWSKHCPCHCHFNFSSILNLGLNFCILPSSSTNNGSNKMLIGEPFKERTHQRTYHGQWHINKTLTYQIDLMIFEEIWSSFIRLSYNKKLQQITNQKSCLIRKKCIPLTRISGSKPCPCTNQWWRASTEHLQSTFLNRAWS